MIEESSFIPSSVKLNRPNMRRKQNKYLANMNRGYLDILKAFKVKRNPVVLLKNPMSNSFSKFAKAELKLHTLCEKYKRNEENLPKFMTSIKEIGSNTKSTIGLQLLTQNGFKLMATQPITVNSKANKMYKERPRLTQYKLRQGFTKSLETLNSKLKKSPDTTIESYNILKKLPLLNKQIYIRSNSALLNLRIIGSGSASFLLRGKLALLHTNLKKTLKIKFPKLLA